MKQFDLGHGKLHRYIERIVTDELLSCDSLRWTQAAKGDVRDKWPILRLDSDVGRDLLQSLENGLKFPTVVGRFDCNHARAAVARNSNDPCKSQLKSCWEVALIQAPFNSLKLIFAALAEEFERDVQLLGFDPGYT